MPFETQALAFFHSGAVAVMVHAWLTTGAGLNVVLTHTMADFDAALVQGCFKKGTGYSGWLPQHKQETKRTTKLSLESLGLPEAKSPS